MYLQPLKSGDNIGIISPSSPGTVMAKARYDRAKKFLSDKGFNIIDGSMTGKSDYYRSGSIHDRVNEINELLRNPDVNCIISSIGGMNSNSLLPYIDYNQMIKTPKIMVGYSDISAILLAMYKKTGIHTFYGPAMIPTFGELEPLADMAFDYFYSILSGKLSLPYTLTNPKVWTEEFVPWDENETPKTLLENHLVTINGGKAKGRLIGGNLDTILGIWGSEYMPEIKEGDILFLEDGMHRIETAERNFALMKICGVFDRIAGLIIGKHELFDDRGSGRKYYEVLIELTGKLNIPVLAEFDCGHTKPMFTLPIGSIVSLDASKQELCIVNMQNWMD